MSEQLDVEALRRLHRQEYALPPDFEPQTSVSVLGATWDLVLDALEERERLRVERDNARQALDRQTEQLAAALAELPPVQPGTAFGLPLFMQVRDLRQRAGRLEAALREFASGILPDGDHVPVSVVLHAERALAGVLVSASARPVSSHFDPVQVADDSPWSMPIGT